MGNEKIHRCQCPLCRSLKDHPLKTDHFRINLLLRHLNEQQRRWYAGLESLRLGHGGDRQLSQITGMAAETIARGRREIQSQMQGRPRHRIRRPGAGRPLLEKKILPSSLPSKS